MAESMLFNITPMFNRIEQALFIEHRNLDSYLSQMFIKNFFIKIFFYKKNFI